jgi:hypothetical protein
MKKIYNYKCYVILLTNKERSLIKYFYKKLFKNYFLLLILAKQHAHEILVAHDYL